ncbi:MAG TPA: hypothetical protein VN081_03385 [Dongiaceae bacterium]|nr:hypothetical protein [Dongiaceae bacterium]
MEQDPYDLCTEYASLKKLSDEDLSNLAHFGIENPSVGNVVDPLVYRILARRGLVHLLEDIRPFQLGFDHHNPYGPPEDYVDNSNIVRGQE